MFKMTSDISFERKVKALFTYYNFAVFYSDDEGSYNNIPLVWPEFCSAKKDEMSLESLSAFDFICDTLIIDPEVLDERRKYFNLSFFLEKDE